MKPHAYQGDKRIRRPARECQLLSSESKAYFDYLNGSGGMFARGEGVCQWGNRNAVRAAINRPGGNPCEVVTFCGVDLVLVSPKANYLKRDRNSSSSNTKRSRGCSSSDTRAETRSTPRERACDLGDTAATKAETEATPTQLDQTIQLHFTDYLLAAAQHRGCMYPSLVLCAWADFSC